MSNHGLIINNKRYTSISGPIGFVLMYPKPELYYSWLVKGLKLPVFMLLGDYHDSGNTMCSDNNTGISITSQEWYSELDKLSKEQCPVRYYIETYLGKPKVDTFKTQPIRWVTQNYFECISNRTTCPTNNIEWISSEIRYESSESCIECSLNFILINVMLLLRENSTDINEYVNSINSAINKDHNTEIHQSSLALIKCMLSGDYKSFINILISEDMKDKSILSNMITNNNVLNDFKWWKTQLEYMYNIEVDEYQKLSQTIETYHNQSKPVLEFINKIINNETVEFNNELFNCTDSLLGYVVDFFLPIIDIYTLMTTFATPKNIDKIKNPSLVVYNAGNKHIKILSKYLQKYFLLKNEETPYSDTYPKIWSKKIQGIPQKCINIKYTIDLNKILNMYSGVQTNANQMMKVLQNYDSVNIEEDINKVKSQHILQTQHIKKKLL